MRAALRALALSCAARDCAGVSAADATTSGAAPAQTVSTIVGPPEVVGGPTCCMFDSPFNAINVGGVTLGYTSNSESYVFSAGASVDDVLANATLIGLNADPNRTAYSNCGKWLNAAWVDDATGVVHGYYHQEWHCNYADGGYTNKSVAYAVSTDGGRSFNVSPVPSPSAPGANQIIAGSNFSTTHQCGEGDHGVVQWGDYLYLYFIEWDGPPSIHGGTSLGVARSAVSDAGRPGTWWKWYNGGWGSPGVGGPADNIDGMPGTAVYSVPDVSSLVSVGVIFSAPLNIAWSSDGLAWTPATAGPLFTAAFSSWNRNANSSELFGYPALTGPQGTSSGVPTNGSYTYFTYLSPGTGFDHRWLVRRPVIMYSGASAAPGTAPVALATLSVWTGNSSMGGRQWATSGPIAPDYGYTLTRPSVALLATWAPPMPMPVLKEVQECAVPVPGGPAGAVGMALTLYGECGAAPAFAGGKVVRTSGWVAQSSADAGAWGWAQVNKPGPGGGTAGTAPAQLWRCVSTTSTSSAGAAGALPDYSVALGADSTACATTAGPGFSPDVMLGYALVPLAA